MRLSEYLSRIEILKTEIAGCNNLIDFYQNKKKQLTLELEKLLNIKVEEQQNDNWFRKTIFWYV